MKTSISRRDFLLGTTAAGIAAALPSTAGAQRGEGKSVPTVLSTWRHGLAANEAAWEVLARGGSAIDAVEAGVRVPEADPEVTSVGYGGYPNADGFVELDAAIMEGTSRNAGSVGALQRIRHPISVARKVMDETRHVMLVGEGALRFARSQGFEEEELLTEKSKVAYGKWKAKGGKDGRDTIGMVAVDKSGNVAAACTTSGLAWKIPGRVGDSPLVGAGLYADSTAGGASATGVGEEIIKICGSFLIVESIRRGATPQEACDEAIRRTLQGHPENEKVQVAYIALDRQGSVGAASMRPGFQYALRTAEGGGLHDVKPAVAGGK